MFEDEKCLYGDFIPSGPQKPGHQVAKSCMKDIVDCFKKILLSDWNDVSFVIGTNLQDFIEIKFTMATVDNLKGLHSYLNTLLSCNDDLMRY